MGTLNTLIYLVLTVFALLALGLFLDALILKGSVKVMGGAVSYGRALLVNLLAFLFLIPAMLAAMALWNLVDFFIFHNSLPSISPLRFPYLWPLQLPILYLLLRNRISLPKMGVVKVILLFAVVRIVYGQGLVVMNRHWGIEPLRVSGIDMSPTLKPQEFFLIRKFPKEYHRGDIVVFRSPQNISSRLVSRLIGLPGEKLEIHGGDIWINGQKLDESQYLSNDIATVGQTSLQLKEGEYYLLGDNRGKTIDSRDLGPIPKQYIQGAYWLTLIHADVPKQKVFAIPGDQNPWIEFRSTKDKFAVLMPKSPEVDEKQSEHQESDATLNLTHYVSSSGTNNFYSVVSGEYSAPAISDPIRFMKNMLQNKPGIIFENVNSVKFLGFPALEADIKPKDDKLKIGGRFLIFVTSNKTFFEIYTLLDSQNLQNGKTFIESFKFPS